MPHYPDYLKKKRSELSVPYKQGTDKIPVRQTTTTGRGWRTPWTVIRTASLPLLLNTEPLFVEGSAPSFDINPVRGVTTVKRDDSVFISTYTPAGTPFSKIADGDGYTSSTDETYATARTGSTLGEFQTEILVGQKFGSTLPPDEYHCYEGLLTFDVSELVDTTGMQLRLKVRQKDITAGYDFEVRLLSYQGYYYETSVNTWMDPADFGLYVEVGDPCQTADYEVGDWMTWDFGDGYEWPADYDFYLLIGSRHLTGTAPTLSEFIRFHSSQAVSEDDRPVLVNRANSASITEVTRHRDKPVREVTSAKRRR